MSEIVKKRTEIFDVRNPYYCVWLQEMAEKGLIYESSGLFTTKFRKGSPEKRRYRIAEKSADTMTPDELELYTQSGWRRENSFITGVTLFSTDDENAPEIYSDNVSYLKEVKVQLVLSVLWAIMLLQGVLGVVEWFFPSIFNQEQAAIVGRLHSYIEESFGILFSILMLVFSVVFIILGIREIKHVRMYSGLSEKKYDVSYNAPAYLRAKKTEIINQIAIILLVFIMFSPIILYMIPNGLLEGEQALRYNEKHPAMFRDVDPLAWEEASSILTWPDYIPPVQGEEDVKRYANYYTETYGWSRVLKHRWIEYLSMNELFNSEYLQEAKYVWEYYSKYAVARSEEIAEEYLGEEIAFDKYEKVEGADLKREMEDIQFECDGIDYAGYSVTDVNEDGVAKKQHRLYLRKGTDIQIINYTGELDLREKMDIFISEFNE